ncbi:MAG TPA: hypothetical protein DCY18_05375 [Thauera sp.]|jgi:hypothetical protein|nr:hypothetical protein [Thauera sp.]
MSEDKEAQKVAAEGWLKAAEERCRELSAKIADARKLNVELKEARKERTRCRRALAALTPPESVAEPVSAE